MKMQLSMIVWAYANVGFMDEHLFHQVGPVGAVAGVVGGLACDRGPPDAFQRRGQ